MVQPQQGPPLAAIDSVCMSYFVYVMYSIQLRKFYIGSSSDVETRIKKHLSNHAGFTGKAKDWIVLLIEEYPTKSEALNREMKLKRWKSNERMWQFIEKCHREALESPSLFPDDGGINLFLTG